MADHSCGICKADPTVRAAVEKDLDNGMLLRDAEAKWNFSRSMLSLHGRWLKEERALALRRKQMAGRQVDLRGRRVIVKQLDGRFRLNVVYDQHANAIFAGTHGVEPVFLEEADLKPTDIVMRVVLDPPLPRESDQQE